MFQHTPQYKWKHRRSLAYKLDHSCSWLSQVFWVKYTKICRYLAGEWAILTHYLCSIYGHLFIKGKPSASWSMNQNGLWNWRIKAFYHFGPNRNASHAASMQSSRNWAESSLAGNKCVLNMVKKLERKLKMCSSEKALWQSAALIWLVAGAWSIGISWTWGVTHCIISANRGSDLDLMQLMSWYLNLPSRPKPPLTRYTFKPVWERISFFSDCLFSFLVLIVSQAAQSPPGDHNWCDLYLVGVDGDGTPPKSSGYSSIMTENQVLRCKYPNEQLWFVVVGADERF